MTDSPHIHSFLHMLRQVFPLFLTIISTFSIIHCSPAKENQVSDAELIQTPWIEPEFPFFSTVLDLRDYNSTNQEKDAELNIVPRGLIVSLGHNLWACFDVDLLRIAAIWEGESGQPPVTLNALAPGSYHIAGQKTKDGQDFIPKPIGRMLFINGVYPGGQTLGEGTILQLKDPRPTPFSEEEVGRGALPENMGRFNALKLHKDGVTLKYQINGVSFDATFPNQHEIKNISGFEYEVPAHDQPLVVFLGKYPKMNPKPAGTDAPKQKKSSGSKTNDKVKDKDKETAKKSEPEEVPAPTAPPTPPQLLVTATQGSAPVIQQTPQGLYYLHIPASAETQKFRLAIQLPGSATGSVVAEKSKGSDSMEALLRWNTQAPIVSSGKLSSKIDNAYVTDDIPFPVNPWNRKLRLADITFLDDQGNAAAISFDGDIWLVSGLKDDLSNITWKRYASGLHEPMSIVARGKELFVFDRNGIWQILDEDGNGEAETHRLFCNLFTQTAETREFPNSMKLGPDGSFYLAKGGQQGSTIGKDNGTVLRVAPDGKSYTVLGHGLRQPFIGVHPKTGLVTASDQQGNYVPSTPIHIIKDGRYYGFLSDLLPKEQYPEPIAEPICWIPHPVNPSGASQVWLTGAQMGDLSEECIHIGYNRPELFRVLLDDVINPTRATVIPFSRELGLSPLNGSVNPADGQLYVTGFQVWGTTAKQISGLARIRYTGKPRVLLKDCLPTKQGVLLTFNRPLDPATASDLANYSVERWNYKRTHNYGSPHLKMDGQPGQDWMQPSSVYLSTDQKSVFIGLPDMKLVMQMRVGWAIKDRENLPAENSAYFTPARLEEFDPVKAGFGDIKIDLTPKVAATKPATPEEKPTAEQGRRIAEMFGCMACHSIDGSVVGKVGPSWQGLFKSKRTLKDGKTEVRADDDYLYESIINPSAKVVKGYEKFDSGMPIYNGILNETQIQSLILYIKTL